MEKSGLERLSPLIGVIGVVLIIAGAMITGFFSYLPAADEVAAFYNTRATQAALGGYLGVLSGFFFIWFAASLRSELRRHEAGEGRLSDLAFAGGVAAALVIGLGFSLIATAAARASAPGGISTVGAITLYDLSSTVQGGLYAVALAVMIEATAVVAFRHRAFPSWFGWVSSILALILLTPYGYIGLFVAPVWLAAVSIWLYARGRMAGTG